MDGNKVWTRVLVSTVNMTQPRLIRKKSSIGRTAYIRLVCGHTGEAVLVVNCFRRALPTVGSPIPQAEYKKASMVYQ